MLETINVFMVAFGVHHLHIAIKSLNNHPIPVADHSKAKILVG